jgi:hypothetical protein
MIRKSSLISSQTKVDRESMAQVRILSLCFLLLLGSPISLKCDDGIFVDSRLNLGLGHARNGKVVCETTEDPGIMAGEHICAEAAHYQRFSTHRGNNSYFDCTIGGTNEGRVVVGSFFFSIDSPLGI